MGRLGRFKGSDQGWESQKTCTPFGAPIRPPWTVHTTHVRPRIYWPVSMGRVSFSAHSVYEGTYTRTLG